jgi:hypothetical protein
LHNLALFWAKNAIFSAEFFGENILKIITSVPGHPVRVFDLLMKSFFFMLTESMLWFDFFSIGPSEQRQQKAATSHLWKKAVRQKSQKIALTKSRPNTDLFFFNLEINNFCGTGKGTQGLRNLGKLSLCKLLMSLTSISR